MMASIFYTFYIASKNAECANDNAVEKVTNLY
jgi:hypothetical protein